jgi:hypothetical protein
LLIIGSSCAYLSANSVIERINEGEVYLYFFIRGEGLISPAGWQLKEFQEYGILTNTIMPTQAALVTMLAFIDKFQDKVNFPGALYWFLQASRHQRYSGSGTTSLDEDLKDIYTSDDFPEAMEKLLKRFRHEDPIEAEEFLKDYSDNRFGRFMLYLLVYRNKALDWDEHSHRLGFEGAAILSNFQPQWHHIFPKQYLKDNVNHDLVDRLANIAVIGPSINIRISNKEPLSYVEKYKITPEKLHQQFIRKSGLISLSDWQLIVKMVGAAIQRHGIVPRRTFGPRSAPQRLIGLPIPQTAYLSVPPVFRYA